QPLAQPDDPGKGVDHPELARPRRLRDQQAAIVRAEVEGGVEIVAIGEAVLRRRPGGGRRAGPGRFGRLRRRRRRAGGLRTRQRPPLQATPAAMRIPALSGFSAFRSLGRGGRLHSRRNGRAGAATAARKSGFGSRPCAAALALARQAAGILRACILWDSVFPTGISRAGILGLGSFGRTGSHRCTSMHGRRGVTVLAVPLRLATPGRLSFTAPCRRRPAFWRLSAAIGVHHSMSIPPRNTKRHAAGAYRFVGEKIAAPGGFANRFFETSFERQQWRLPGINFFTKGIFIARSIGYKPPTPSGAAPLLGNRLTVDPRTLTPLVLVRIQVPQPILPKSPDSLVFPAVPDPVLASLAT